MSRGNKKKQSLISIIIAVIIVISAVITFLPGNLWKKWIHRTADSASFTLSDEQNQAEQQPLSVHYIDVGQGDSTLILFEEHAILIDCAKKSNEQNVFDYLESHGIETLDMVIATHPDADHIGGFTDLVYRIKPQLYLLPMLPDSIKRTKTEITLMNTLKTLNVRTEYAVNGKVYEFGEMKLYTYVTEQEHDDKNDYSVVTRITYKNASYLFMGDAGKTVENELMQEDVNLSAYVLKAGHHGSSKSSGERFVKYVNPSICVFSCGLDNDYGHPHNEVLSIVKKQNITALRTDLNGNIVIGTDGTHYYTYTQK